MEIDFSKPAEEIAILIMDVLPDYLPARDAARVSIKIIDLMLQVCPIGIVTLSGRFKENEQREKLLEVRAIIENKLA